MARRHRDTRNLEKCNRVLEMYSRGLSQSQIAVALGCTQPNVCQIMRRWRETWVEENREHWETRLAEELAKQAAVIQAAWTAWDESREPLEPGGAKRPGNADYLATITRALELRARCLGLVRPGNAAVVQVVNGIDWSALYRPVADSEVDQVDRELKAIDATLRPEVNVQAPGHNGDAHEIPSQS
jgi:hypothetical protein